MNEIIINGVKYTSKMKALEALNAIQDDPKISVGELKPGDRFIYGGIEWVKLDDAYGGSLVLTVDIQADSEFSENGSNNWTRSSLRKSLNTTIDGQFITKFLKGVIEDDLIKFERDLTTDDGMTEYGTCKDFVSLYTCDEYRKYRKFIPECRDYHWTITGFCLIYSELSRAVQSDGCIGTYFVPKCCFGVRPLCVLKPDVEVKVE